MQLVDDIYCYSWQGKGNNCNSYVLRYFVDGDARYVLIDPGHRVVPVPVISGGKVAGIGQEPGLDLLVKLMKADGIDPGKVELVINTHAHGDHCESSLWWKEEQGSLIAVHEAEKNSYSQAVLRASGNGRSSEAAGEPDLLLDEGDLVLGKPPANTLQILHTPGHSPGSVSIYWPDQKVLIAGDLVFYRGVGRTDLSGSSVVQMRASIEKVAQLDVEHLLTGHAYGHPGIISGKERVVQNFRLILVGI